jgi:TRAP-type C4-dicarboxylate transport system permease small subunit
MKKMFFKILLIGLLLVPAIMVASTLTTVFQDDPVENVDFLALALEYAKFTFIGMIMLAINHVVAGTFNLRLWLSDSLIPALFAYGGGLAIAALDIYAKSWDFFVEQVVGAPTDYTDFTNLAITGMVLVAFVKGLFKIRQTQEKVATKKAEAKKAQG